MRPNHVGSVIWIIGIGLLFQACSLFGTDASGDILSDQAGTLLWSGSPAADGAGMLFKTEDETYYGVPGTREDYADYFPENKNQIQIIADIKRTGEKTVRGWGVEYPEIKILRIKGLQDPE
ncbi:hypothetical protein [Fodinibius salsisoli]|uniref:Uncharacterized protein n=1 Tax=Fodinibius salsisoli TaxID=2820877 RepID=A0ABT3PI24_9BACT|nr:hypothetical protein [Fodinibius salsisoli]MCW9705567.1 hypothetical protein [Fodinibius salsisoli]